MINSSQHGRQKLHVYLMSNIPHRSACCVPNISLLHLCRINIHRITVFRNFISNSNSMQLVVSVYALYIQRYLGCVAGNRHFQLHDNVIKWRHFPCYWSVVRGIHRSPVNFPHKGQWRGALMFSMICAWINGWVNNGEAGHLKCHRAHYDVTVMWSQWYYSYHLYSIFSGSKNWIRYV